jgi:Arc/MetJ family transcription regulator
MSQLVEDCLKRIRTSEELGEGSCSSVDECQTDDELREEILEEIELLGDNATVETVFQNILKMDNDIMDIMRERESESMFW